MEHNTLRLNNACIPENELTSFEGTPCVIILMLQAYIACKTFRVHKLCNLSKHYSPVTLLIIPLLYLLFYCHSHQKTARYIVLIENEPEKIHCWHLVSWQLHILAKYIQHLSENFKYMWYKNGLEGAKMFQCMYLKGKNLKYYHIC